MTKARILAIACAGVCAAAIAGPLDSLRGKMKEGMYEYKMEMDMGAVPGMPPGVGKQTRSFQKCVTREDIEKGHVSRGPDRQGKAPECDIKNVSTSGNTTSYTMECQQPKMTADNKITITGEGFNMDMKMAMEQGGRVMNMTQHMEGKYLGPCK
jgi:hypothetical protein